MTRLLTANGRVQAVRVARRACRVDSSGPMRVCSQTFEQHTPHNCERSAGALCFCRRGVWLFDGRARQLLLRVPSDDLEV